jgi:LPXTG-motif cell wall-anchored protein
MRVRAIKAALAIGITATSVLGFAGAAGAWHGVGTATQECNVQTGERTITWDVLNPDEPWWNKAPFKMVIESDTRGVFAPGTMTDIGASATATETVTSQPGDVFTTTVDVSWTDGSKTVREKPVEISITPEGDCAPPVVVPTISMFNLLPECEGPLEVTINTGSGNTNTFVELIARPDVVLVGEMMKPDSVKSLTVDIEPGGTVTLDLYQDGVLDSTIESSRGLNECPQPTTPTTNPPVTTPPTTTPVVIDELPNTGVNAGVLGIIGTAVVGVGGAAWLLSGTRRRKSA